LNQQITSAVQDGRTILVPSRRAARAIQLDFARAAARSGRLVWHTPDVITASAWLERVYLAHRNPAQSRRLLKREQTAVLWHRAVAESAAATVLTNVESAARVAARSWTRAIDFDISPAALAADPSEEARTLLDWSQSVAGICAAGRWITAAELLQELAHQTFGVTERLFVAQPEELTPAQRALFASLANRGADIACAQPQAIATTQSIEGVHAGNDPDHELELAARWARIQVENGASRIGVIVPDLANRTHAVRRIFDDVFVPGRRKLGRDALESPVEIAAATPLDRYPVVRSALDLIELAYARVPNTIAGAILRSPFAGEGLSESSQRALADLRARRENRETFDLAGFEQLTSAAGCTRLALRARTLLEEPPSRRRERAAPSEWAERYLAALAVWGWPGERSPTTDEQQTIEKFREALAAFGSFDDIVAELDSRAALSEFARLVAATPFEPRVLPSPVVVIDPQTVIGMQFDALWIAGLTATRWPPAPDPDPFLPHSLQVRAGMPIATAAGMRELARRRLHQLLGSSPHVVASYYRFDGDAQEIPSPWIAGRPGLPAPESPIRSYRETVRLAQPALEVFNDPAAPPVRPGRVRGGARTIELQSNCPFRAQAEIRLAARPLESVGPGVGLRERGQLIHQALDDLWRELRSSAALARLDAAALRDRVRAHLTRALQRLLTGASPARARFVAIEAALAEARILELCARERERRPFAVFEGPERAESIRLGHIELDVRIDRIDAIEPDELVIIDYKTGRSADARDWRGPRPRQPQLPLYAVAHRDRVGGVAFAVLARGQVGFSGVTRASDMLPGVRAWPHGSDDAHAEWQALLNEWQTTVERLAAEFAAGNSRVDPLPLACRLCHLATFCRIDDAKVDVSADPEHFDGR
jgi:probable DNA repair protein